MMNIVLFETPEAISHLQPLSITRPLFKFRMGAYSLHELLDYLKSQTTPDKNIHLYTLRPYTHPQTLQEQAETHKLQTTALPFIEKQNPITPSHEQPTVTPTLYINAALIPDEPFLTTLLKALFTFPLSSPREHHNENSKGTSTTAPIQFLWSEESTEWAHAALKPPENTLAFLTAQTLTTTSELFEAIKTAHTAAPNGSYHHIETRPLLIRELHELLNAHETLLSQHLNLKIQASTKTKTLHELAPYVFYETPLNTPPPKVDPLVLRATALDPIFIANATTLGAYSVLTGPLYIGSHSRISPHSQLRASSLGHHTRIGGEITHSIFHDFSNKSHFGFCGHSVIGSWVNLGAGTTTSNLKNNYQNAKLKRADGEVIPTERTFLGAFLADYVKTAILVGIYGGKTIGLATNVVSTVTHNLPNFHFLDKTLSLESILTAQKAMFARRHRAPTPHEQSVLRTTHALELKKQQRQ